MALPSTDRRPRPQVFVATLVAAAAMVAACGASTPTADVSRSPTPSTSADTSATTSPAAPASSSTTVPDRASIVVAYEAGVGLDQALIDATPAFTAATGIDVEYVESERVPQLITREAAVKPYKPDVVVLSSFELGRYAANGWLQPIPAPDEVPADYDGADLLPSVRAALSYEGAGSFGTKVYGEPITASSSMVAYRPEVLAAAGVTLGDQPTWAEVAAAARAAHTDEQAGICLRGEPTWVEAGATLTAMVHAFGGRWWDYDLDRGIGPAQVASAEFREAARLYVDLLADAGPDEPWTLSGDDCVERYRNGEVAMLYDTTDAAFALEAADSPVHGQSHYTSAPTGPAGPSPWLDVHAFAIPIVVQEVEPAVAFLEWATAEPTMAQHRPLTHVDADPTAFIDAVGPAADVLVEAVATAPTTVLGSEGWEVSSVQFSQVPEFEPVATVCSHELSTVWQGTMTFELALTRCHDLAQNVASW